MFSCKHPGPRLNTPEKKDVADSFRWIPTTASSVYLMFNYFFFSASGVLIYTTYATVHVIDKQDTQRTGKPRALNDERFIPPSRLISARIH